MMEMLEMEEDIPFDIKEVANNAIANLLPEKSKVQYGNTYKKFKDARSISHPRMRSTSRTLSR